jgi:hypothetical protein
MNIEFKYELKKLVLISAINVLGFIIGYYYGETGKQYQVTYFHNGEKKTLYLFEEELEEPTGSESMGFKT